LKNHRIAYLESQIDQFKEIIKRIEVRDQQHPSHQLLQKIHDLIRDEVEDGLMICTEGLD
jgi:Spy/CpxP family protein refolding chaperone